MKDSKFMRGQIWWMEGYEVHKEGGKRRPALIVSNDIIVVEIVVNVFLNSGCKGVKTVIIVRACQCLVLNGQIQGLCLLQ